MGSLDKYCRLCAANVRPEQLLKLYEVRIAVSSCWSLFLLSGRRSRRDDSLDQAQELPQHGAEPRGQAAQGRVRDLCDKPGLLHPVRRQVRCQHQQAPWYWPMIVMQVSPGGVPATAGSGCELRGPGGGLPLHLPLPLGLPWSREKVVSCIRSHCIILAFFSTQQGYDNSTTPFFGRTQNQSSNAESRPSTNVVTAHPNQSTMQPSGQTQNRDEKVY